MIFLAAPSPPFEAGGGGATTGADTLLATLAGLDAVVGALEMTVGAASGFAFVRELMTLLPS